MFRSISIIPTYPFETQSLQSHKEKKISRMNFQSLRLKTLVKFYKVSGGLKTLNLEGDDQQDELPVSETLKIYEIEPEPMKSKKFTPVKIFEGPRATWTEKTLYQPLELYMNMAVDPPHQQSSIKMLQRMGTTI